MISSNLLLFCACLSAGLVGCAGAPTQIQETTLPGSTGVLDSLSGVWQDSADPDFFLEVAGTQILIASSGRIREASTVLRPTDKGLLVCQAGHEVPLALRQIGDVVEFFHSKEGKARRLVRAGIRPEALALALELPQPSPLPESRIQAIQREIRLRFQSDQSLFRQRIRGQDELPSWLQVSGSTESNQKPEWIDLLAVERFGVNAEYMKNLLLEIGWIDAKRFGYPTSRNAFLLVQHSWDISLMLGVLPRIEEDVDAGLMPGEDYALMYDRVQVSLGRLQRFGSQILKEPTGEWIVLPLEDPEGVEARRREKGMLPLKEYVGVFGAAEVKLSTECSALASPVTGGVR